jgi:hypothetical protein
MIAFVVLVFCHCLGVAIAQSTRPPSVNIGDQFVDFCSLNTTSSFVQAGQMVVVLSNNGTELRIAPTNTGGSVTARTACRCPNPSSLGCRDLYDGSGDVEKWSVRDSSFRSIGGWLSFRLRRDNTDAIRPKGPNNYVFTPLVSTLDVTKIRTNGFMSNYLDTVTSRWGFGICSEERNVTIRSFPAVSIVFHFPCWLSSASGGLARQDIGRFFALNSNDSDSEHTLFFLIQRTAQNAATANVTVFDVDRHWSADSETAPFPLGLPSQFISIGDDDRNRTMLSVTFDTMFGTDDPISIPHAANRSHTYLCFNAVFGSRTSCPATTATQPPPTTSTSTPASSRSQSSATSSVTRSESTTTATTTTRSISASTTTTNTTASTRTTIGTGLAVVDGRKEPDDSVDTIAIILFVVGGVLVVIGVGFVLKMLR